MNNYRVLFTIALLITVIYAVAKAEDVQAQYAPPDNITLIMYQLDDAGSAAPDYIPCTPGSLINGCTADPGNTDRAYPFASSTITVTIDGTAADDRYLRDVVAQEMSPSTHLPVAVEAQAIAARTYAYWHIETDAVTPGAIDNSNAYQVFLPYRYDQFSANEQAVLAAALQNRQYMSNYITYTVNIYGQNVSLGEREPIFAEFFADVPTETVTSPTFPYLASIAEPISTHPDVPLNGHGRGLSQNGAGRWVRGSSSFRCDPAPAPCPGIPPTIPHYAWSVRWSNVKQILTHYYTSIHLRDAAGAITTPTRRWVPLEIFGLESPTDTINLCRGGRTGFGAEIQNTGVLGWGSNAFDLSYRPSWSIPTGQGAEAATYVPAVASGATTTTLVFVNVPDYVTNGSYTMELDMRAFSTANPGDFRWFSEDGWDSYMVNVEVTGDCEAIYLPLIQNNAVTATGQ